MTIHGNTNGLSPSDVHALERLYRRRAPFDRLVTPELARSMAEVSRSIGRHVGVLADRSGNVEFVVVGDASKLFLPDLGRLRAAQGRFRGLRLIATHLTQEGLRRDEIVDLTRLRLDLLVTFGIGADGQPEGVHYAHLIAPGSGPEAAERAPRRVSTTSQPQSSSRSTRGAATLMPAYRSYGPLSYAALIGERIEVDPRALIASVESDFARAAKLRVVAAKDGRAILVHVCEKHDGARHDGSRSADERAEESLRELGELARTAGVEVVDSVLQMRERIDPKFVVGRGKLDEIVLRSMHLDATVLIFDRNLGPAQAAAIAKVTDLKVIDRSQLILDIFAQRAESRDGKLQVELAQMKYLLPRLGQKDDSLSRLTGGIGGRGPGETVLEIGKRRARERISRLEAELERLSVQRRQRRHRRARRDVPIVSIVGYTNAGKSTLLNALTGSDTTAEDKLFATLDTRSRRIRFPHEREVVVTDTVGFIRDLPKDLFSAFRATFEEAEDADLLLEVIDASDPTLIEHMRTTELLLGELGLSETPTLRVFNKADRLEAGHAENLARSRGGVAVSALNPASFGALLARMEMMLYRPDALETTSRDDESVLRTRGPREVTPLHRPSSNGIFDDLAIDEAIAAAAGARAR